MTEPTEGYLLAPPPPPEAPLTARNLEDYEECPRKYLLSHFATRAETRDFSGGPAALHRAVRTALLEMYKAGGPEVLGLPALLESFEGTWDGSLCKDSREEEDLRRDGLRMLEQHWSEPLSVTSTLSVDLRLEAELSGHRLVAVADLLIGQGSPLPQVVRLTTSRRPPSPGELIGGFSWGLLYLLAARHLGGTDVQGLMVDLRRGRQVTYALSSLEQEDLVRRLAAVAGQIRRDQTFVAKKGGRCRWCRSRGDCPAWRK